MRPIQHDSYVAGIDDEARAELVRKVLQDRQAQLVSWREEPMGGGGSGSELYTVSGEATSSGSTVLPWKLILKMFNHEGEGWQETSTDPMAWDYWKREWLVYQAPWIHDLREGLVAPHCFGAPFGWLLKISPQPTSDHGHRATSRRLRDISVSSTVVLLSTATRRRTRG